jgi:hypothetical protein
MVFSRSAARIGMVLRGGPTAWSFVYDDRAGPAGELMCATAEFTGVGAVLVLAPLPSERGVAGRPAFQGWPRMRAGFLATAPAYRVLAASLDTVAALCPSAQCPETRSAERVEADDAATCRGWGFHWDKDVHGRWPLE